MQKAQLPEPLPIWLTASFHETERACLALVETEIEVAFSFLRLAEAETQGGKVEHATHLISKAAGTYNVVLKYIENMRAEFAFEKCELRGEARRLLEGIQRAWRLQTQSDDPQMLGVPASIRV
jgi:hypothetical protein